MAKTTFYATARGDLVEYRGTMVMETCFKCGIPFAMPAEFKKYVKSNRATFWCPNGHGQIYTKSDEAQLREEIEHLQRSVDHYQDTLNAERRSHSATKAQLTKARKRAAAGVCLHCGRTFQNVARHVRTKHPEQLEGGGAS